MSDLHNAKKYAVRRKRHSIWRNIVTCIAAVVVFCTTYALILPAITMEYSCGKEEHVHAEGCYKLTCGLEQTPGHFHDETCYNEEGKLICGQEEPQSHAHTEACYAPADPTAPTDPICGLEETAGHTHDSVTCYALPKVLSCGQEEVTAHTHDPAACYTEQTELVCGQEESAGHTHADACYTRSLTCGQEEGETHTHSDACYSSTLTCGQTETAGHTHTDACYAVTSVLTCTQPETAGHSHTDACYTLGDVPELICTQEETPGHTHTDACYDPASRPQLICGKEEVEVHKHTDECYTLVCTLEEHTHTNECQVKDEEPTEEDIPTEEELPTDAILEEEIPADAAPCDVALLAETERGPFFSHIKNPEAGTTVYDSVNQIYSTSINFDFSVTGAELKQTNGEFYILVSDKISVPEYGRPFTIKNSDDEETGKFWFVRDETTGRAKMIIDFDKDKVANLEDDQIISGEMYFSGTVDKSAMKEDGHLEFELTEGVPIKVSNDKINNDNQAKNNYDLIVAKSSQIGEPTLPEGNTPGTATVHYEVEISSTKGTPDVINVNDSLGWTSGNPTGCKMQNLTVKKINPTTGETKPEFTPDIKDKNWSMELPKLEPGEKYVVSYDYVYTFANGDTTMVKSAANTVKATSKIPGGRPEDTVDGEDTEIIEKIIPPSPDPSLDKSGKENKADKKIDWTVTFNEDGKRFGGESQPQITLTDTQLADASDLKVVIGGSTLTEGTHYRIEDGNLILLTPTESTDKIVITYSTSSDALNAWSSDEKANWNKVDNTVSYTGKFGNTIETTETLEKEGGALSKYGGTAIKENGKLTIPWQITITPGSDGIPDNKKFTDTVDYGEFGQTIDASSLEVYYVNDKGQPICDDSGKPIPVVGYPGMTVNSPQEWNGGKQTMEFTFGQNPFTEDVIKKGAAKIVVRYNTTTTKVPNRDYTFNNDTEVGEKKDHESVPYKAIWVRPNKVGTLTEKGDHLDINWKVTFATNADKITEITDTLKSAGCGEHHYSTVPETLTFQLWGKTYQTLKKGTDYTVTYYDADGNEVTNLADGTAVSMTIKFLKEGGQELPLQGDSGIEVVFEYTTSTDDIPDVTTDYYNVAYAFDEDAEAKVPWDPNDLKKELNGEHEVKDNTVTIPWKVTLTSKSGKITTPITDYLGKIADKTLTHHFPADPGLKISVLDQNGQVVGELTQDQYTVGYFGGYTGSPEDGNGVAAAEGKDNVYMVITLLPEGEFVIPNGAKTLQLTYNTVASPVPEGTEVFDNRVWAMGKDADATDTIEPSKPTPEEKKVDNVELADTGIRMHWSATIKRGAAPMTMLEEGTWYDQYNPTFYARHYFDLSTISFEYLDADGNVLPVGQETEGDKSALPTYDMTCYKHCWDSNGILVTDENNRCQGSDPVRFIRLNFHDGDAFAHAPAGAEGLRMKYVTYNNDVTAENSVKFQNSVQVAGKRVDKDTSITKVEKTVQDSNGNWTKNPVDIGETDGTLRQWRIRATTSGERTFLTFTDVLPEYVKLENVELKHGRDQYNINIPLGTFDPATGSFSGTDWDGNTVSSTFEKNADGRYVLTVKAMAKEGTKFSTGHVFDLILTPKADLESIPVSLQGKTFNLTNQATVTHDEGGAPSNPSTQIWTDERPDVADGSIEKGKFPLDGGGKLNYVVTINEEGKDLEPNGNSFVLIDTLTYNGSKFTKDSNPVYDTSPKNALKGYEMRLDTSAENMVRLYKKDAAGLLEVDDEGKIVHGELLSPTEWSMTVDTKTKADGTTEKIIRVTVPDNTPLLMLYSYNVELRTDPVTADVSQLRFTYSAKNTCKMYGHKKVEDTQEKTDEKWQSSTGGGSTKTDYNTFTLKKVDASNNALLLEGAEFAVFEYNGTGWNQVQRDETNEEVKFVTDKSGVLTIQSNEKWMKDNTLYKAYEIVPPKDYLLPDNPQTFYFYRSSDTGTKLDEALIRGATDLAEGSELIWVENTSVRAELKLEKIWKDAQGNTIPGNASQDFEIIQYKSHTMPDLGGGNNPMLSSRHLKITVDGNGWQDEKEVTYDTTKGTMMQLTITNRNPNTEWAKISGGKAVFTPAIPEIQRRLVYVPGTEQVQSIIFTFPVTTVEEATISFEASGNDLSVSLVPVGSGRNAVAAASLEVEGEGTDLIRGKSWTVTLSAGTGWKWDSQNPGPTVNDGNPLPFTETDDEGTWYYTYVVKEINGSAAYTVTYSNMVGDKLQSISSGTIRVTNTRLENPPVSLPNTGGIGTTVFTLAGLALTGGAGLGLCKTSRSKEKRKRGMSEKE